MSRKALENTNEMYSRPWASYNTPEIELIQYGRRISKKVYYFGGFKPVIFCQQTWHGDQREFKTTLPKTLNIFQATSHCKLTTQSFPDHGQGGPLLTSLRAHVAFCVISSRIISAYFIWRQGAAIDAWAHALGESCLCDLTSGKESFTVGEQACN